LQPTDLLAQMRVQIPGFSFRVVLQRAEAAAGAAKLSERVEHSDVRNQ